MAVYRISIFSSLRRKFFSFPGIKEEVFSRAVFLVGAFGPRNGYSDKAIPFTCLFASHRSLALKRCCCCCCCCFSKAGRCTTPRSPDFIKRNPICVLLFPRSRVSEPLAFLREEEEDDDDVEEEEDEKGYQKPLAKSQELLVRTLRTFKLFNTCKWTSKNIHLFSLHFDFSS